MGQLLGVMANPAETLRQLNESREMLRKAKEDMELSHEAKKIPPKHTFSKLPGFHGRETEKALLRRILSNTPKMTVVFGATSVGKTALLREVLASDDFYVIKFDLRISGFADLRTLYLSLCDQFERFFQEMNDEEMNKCMLTFKHTKLEFLKNERPKDGVPGYKITVADLASLMESLQSCLLKYWEYEPSCSQERAESRNGGYSKAKVGLRSRQVDAIQSSVTQSPTPTKPDEPPPFQKRPIIFLMDEAHKLPALVPDPFSLKVFLDTLLVLTKQDRLCHVILATSDSFFQHFLRKMNVGHHSQILTIGDCSKEETLSYFLSTIVPSLPDGLQSKLDFDVLYDAFGGKLAHINDYVSTWTTHQGALPIFQSPIFIQAYTLLQFHLTRPAFETYSPLSTATSGAQSDDDAAKFSHENLLHVMRKMTTWPYSLPYFELCREIGTDAVDSLVQTRILELRWTRSVSVEEEGAERAWDEGGVARPVVLPMTRIVRRAMEVVLREVDARGEEGMGKQTMSVEGESR